MYNHSCLDSGKKTKRQSILASTVLIITKSFRARSISNMQKV